MRKKMLMIGAATPLILLSSLALFALGCNRSADSSKDTTQVAQSAPASNPDAPIMLRGTVVSVSADKLALKSDTGVATVTMAQPFHLYIRVPSDLSKVKENSFAYVEWQRKQRQRVEARRPVCGRLSERDRPAKYARYGIQDCDERIGPR